MIQTFNKALRWGRMLKIDARARRHFRNHPPVFIVGAPRSGTTLLLQVLSAQPTVSQSFEPTHVWEQVLGAGHDDSYVDRLTHREIIKLRIRYFAAVEPSKPVLISKDPRDSLRVKLLAHIFPEARFVHIVRDPRDVIASITKIWNTREQYRTDVANDWVHVRIPGYRGLCSLPSHVKAALMWKCCVESVVRALSVVPESRHATVRYEDMVNEPYAVVAELLGRCVGRFDPQSLRQIVAGVSGNVVDARSRAVENTEFQFTNRWVQSDVPQDAGSGTMSTGARIGKWRESLSDSQLGECMSLLGDSFQRFGYRVN